MPKFRVYGLRFASSVIGEYEAPSEADALEQAMVNTQGNHYVGLCHQCSREVDLGDVFEYGVEEV